LGFGAADSGQIDIYAQAAADQLAALGATNKDD
jgi:hypothetical protein